uniref:CRAL-TRIO domain-containing protein n=1 Tax=Davidia involucrata TaxID=16924 RepID=A0A5B7BU34_DAVIN
MGDSLRVFHPGNNLDSRVITSKKLSKRCVLALTPKVLSHKTLKCVSSMKQGILGIGAAGDIVLFLLKTAALDIVRRFSKAKCPLAWHGLQVLQMLAYPPFKWIQQWAPFKGLVNFMQTLSRPLLVLTIATIFPDKSACTKEAPDSSNDSQTYSESQLGPSAQLSTPDTRSCDEVLERRASEKWLLQLHKELEKQGITLPERLNEDELRRFYAAANSEFPRLLSSVKKTIRWRQTYTILSSQELERWSNLVFWHGCDVKLRPCLIIRLGLACSNLIFNDRPIFVKAVVSQIEHGVMHLVNAENPQITVLMDCEGFSPFGFPMQMMRSCAILLQDHYPNRLGCLIVIRLRPVARVITQTLFQVLRPATQQKVRIVGENFQKVLSEYLETFPYFLGGKCPCSKCSDPVDIQGMNEEMKSTAGPSNHATVTSPDFYYHTDTSMNRNRDQVVRTAIIGVLLLWLIIAFILGMHYPEHLPFLYRQGRS